MPLPLIAGYIGKGIQSGDWNPFSQIGSLWNDLTGVTASQNATDAMAAGTEKGIDEQKRQFDAMQELLAPYTQAGEGALQQQQALSGALGPEAQQAAYDMVQNSPGFQSALQQGENSILQNASATGGLRGGNTQGALAQFSPQLLNQSINQRYGQLGGLSQMGQNSAAGVGAAGMNMGNNVAGAYGQMGQQQGANILGQYNMQRDFVGDLAGFGMQVGQMAAGGGF